MSTPAEILNTEIKMFPGLFTFTIARGRAEFWKSFDAISRLNDNEDGNSIPRFVEGFFVCRFCKHVLKYDSKITGSSTLSRHAENWNKLQGISQPLISSTFKKLTVPSEKQKTNQECIVKILRDGTSIQQFSRERGTYWLDADICKHRIKCEMFQCEGRLVREKDNFGL